MMYRIPFLAVGLMACLLFFSSLLPWTAAQQAQPASPADSMPAGPGKDLVLRICTRCHDVTNIVGQHQDSDGWTAEISKMVGYGAQGSDDDFSTILDYLTKNYGPEDTSGKIDVNKASADDLVAGLGISPKDADAIVAYRQKNGPFRSVEDLEKVPDIDTKKIDDKKAEISFSS